MIPRCLLQSFSYTERWASLSQSTATWPGPEAPPFLVCAVRMNLERRLNAQLPQKAVSDGRLRPEVFMPV